MKLSTEELGMIIHSIFITMDGGMAVDEEILLGMRIFHEYPELQKLHSWAFQEISKQEDEIIAEREWARLTDEEKNHFLLDKA